MTLFVDPPERALRPAQLPLHEEPRRHHDAAPDHRRAGPSTGDSGFDAAAPVGVDPETGAALADLHAVDAVPLATALSRYGEDD